MPCAEKHWVPNTSTSIPAWSSVSPRKGKCRVRCWPGALSGQVCGFQTPGGAVWATGATGYELPGVGGVSSDKVAEFGDRKKSPQWAVSLQPRPHGQEQMVFLET